MRSLRARLAAAVVLALAASVAVGLLLVQLYEVSSTALTDRAAAALDRACQDIAERYAYYSAGWSAPAQAAQDAGFRRDLAALVGFALSGTTGVRGGVWQTDAGLVASAPDGPPPATALAGLAGLAEAVAQSGLAERGRTATPTGTLLQQACPLRGPVPGLTAWTETEVPAAEGLGTLRLGLGVLFALVLALSAALLWLAAAWSRHVGRIERALAGAASDALPRLDPTGEAELDRIVAALNTAGARLEEARATGAALSARVAAAERLASLGRVAAGVAHEIRNPIAAMRLKAENALAGDAARRVAALEAILQQIARLDRLLGELLAMTQPRAAQAEPVDLADLLAGVAAEHPRGGTGVAVACPPLRLMLDPALLRRALDVLLDNAARHTPPDGTVRLRAAHDGAVLRLEVADSGPGIPPALRASLFEPFVTGRADGTGLGLAIARELAGVLGGQLVLADPGGAPGQGAVFTLEVPCRPC